VTVIIYFASHKTYRRGHDVLNHFFKPLILDYDKPHMNITKEENNRL
jgi:hypothetical protein